MPIKPSGGPSAPKTPKADAVKLKVPASPTEASRNKIAKDAQKTLTQKVEDLKDIAGTGIESAGKGNPAVAERRAAVSSLLAGTSTLGIDADALKALSTNVAADVEWLGKSERRDYDADVTGQLGWAANGMANTSNLDAELKSRSTAATERSKAVDGGQAQFFEARDGGVLGLSLISDKELRAKSLADTLLQFRAKPTEAPATPAAPTSSWTTDARKRIDVMGPAVSAEQRMLLEAAKLDATDPSSVREYALLREVIASHPISSVNGIYTARNAVGALANMVAGSEAYMAKCWVRDEPPPGGTVPMYKAIHHNFSRDTASNIDKVISQWAFPVGAEAERGPRFVKLVEALNQARAKDVKGAQAAITELTEGSAAADLKPLTDALAGATEATFADTLGKFLTSTCTKPLGAEPEKSLTYMAQIFEAVCAEQPGADSLEALLFKAGPAWPDVADVIYTLRKDNEVGTLKELGEARLSMRNAIFTAKTGYERQEQILLDSTLSRLTCTELGAAVDRVGNVTTDAERAEAMVAVQTALRSAIASGLHEIKDPADPAADKGRSLPDILADVDASLAKGKIDIAKYRELMGEVRVAVASTVQNIRFFLDGRAAPVAAGGAELDPMFLDQFIKQSPLHYATALAEKGMRSGLKEEIGPRRIANVEGMRVLNSVGPVVFPTVLVAQTGAELKDMKVPRDALTVVYKMEEKKLVMAGGLLVDTKDAPGGNSHLNMYAMNNGIPVIALPELNSAYVELFKNAETEGGIYVDDTNGNFQMMTVAMAKEMGLVDDAKLKELKPGTNRRVEYLKTNAAGDGFDTVATHETVNSPSRPTRQVELYVPMDEVKGLGHECVSYEQLASLGIHGRHLVGEKGLVLALMAAHPTLGPRTPKSSNVPAPRIFDLLKEAGAWDDWTGWLSSDPKVGTITDSNFLESAFYTDSKYRNDVRVKAQSVSADKLHKSLIVTDAAGTKSLSPAGQKLYDELLKTQVLADSDNWIARSSYTGEDRPGKSGAGQYESFPNLKDPVARIQGIIDVIASNWDPEPIENNVAEEINLMHIAPSVVVQHCLKPEFSGVCISRDLDNGARGRVTYQLVKGFGGGVEGGKAEEGLLASSSQTVKVTYPGEQESLIDAAALKELREIVLETEKLFNDVIEPGKGHAVDMEVARENGQWFVVQARVILMDR